MKLLHMKFGLSRIGETYIMIEKKTAVNYSRICEFRRSLNMTGNKMDS